MAFLTRAKGFKGFDKGVEGNMFLQLVQSGRHHRVPCPGVGPTNTERYARGRGRPVLCTSFAEGFGQEFGDRIAYMLTSKSVRTPFVRTLRGPGRRRTASIIGPEMRRPIPSGRTIEHRQAASPPRSTCTT